MRGMRRNLAIIRDPNNQSVDKYVSRFKCYTIYAFAVGIYSFFNCGRDRWAALVGLLFWFDGIMLIQLTSAIKAQEHQDKLQMRTTANVMANAAAVLAYLVLKFSMFRYPVNRSWWQILTFIFVSVSATLKLLVIAQFKKWLQANYSDIAALGQPMASTAHGQSMGTLGGSIPSAAGLSASQAPAFRAGAPAPVVPLQQSAAPGSAQFLVQCPAGAAPGQMIQVQSPSGQMLAVTVPNGVYAGDTFAIQV